MLEPLARRWLRAIAVGIPLAACSTGGSCPPPTTQVAPLTAAEVEEILDMRATLDAGPEASCAPACRDRFAIPSFARIACDVGDDDDGGFVLSCTATTPCRGGRRPAGLIDAPIARGIGASLARTAHLEAASVPAFLELARELELHGAHPALARAARRAARDEIHHAKTIGALARAYGASVPRVERSEVQPRSRRELARDNAIEGCVREAYAALVAAHQAETSIDPRIARAYATIARDEARHALLSFAIHDALADRRSEDARREAIADLVREASIDPTPADRALLGLPAAGRAVDIAEALA